MRKRLHPSPFGAIAILSALLLATAGFTPAANAQSDSQDKVCKQYEFAMGLRYQQKSAEIDALQHQAFNLARMKLDSKIAAHDGDEKLAIVTDVDETLIDNSPLLVRDMRNCHTFTTWDTWGHWEREGMPALNPGAKAFLDHVDRKGVAIFYVSNRFGANKPDTIRTLQDLGLPQVSKDSVMLWSEGNPKTKRRAKVRENHKIVLLLGDTLADFSGMFEGSLQEQCTAVQENAAKFGTDWIVFPNATYGDWTEAELEGWDAPMKIAE
jgi:5'-nucleotidase (lipoprotein e(P4) family)